MPSTRTRPLAIAGAWAALSLIPASAPRAAHAQGGPPALAIPAPVKPRLSVPPRPTPATGSPAGSGGWWMGTAGLAAALAVFGGASLASKRFLPSRDAGPIRVVGRAALSRRHAVTLVRVGDRVLILGTGPQGPPSALGEVTDPDELARLAPRRAAPAPSARPSPAFDRRIGDDE